MTFSYKIRYLVRKLRDVNKTTILETCDNFQMIIFDNFLRTDHVWLNGRGGEQVLKCQGPDAKTCSVFHIFWDPDHNMGHERVNDNVFDLIMTKEKKTCTKLHHQVRLMIVV